MKKLDPRIVWGYFISYPKHYKRYKFYYPSYSVKVAESIIAKFIKLDSVEGSSSQLLNEFEEGLSRSKPLTNVYNGILPTSIDKPK